MKRYMIAISLILSIILLLFVFLIATNTLVVFNARSSQIIQCGSEDKITDKYDAIVVLGAGVRQDGTPSHMLEDRLRGAVELYRAGVSKVIILSGDNSGDDYDEVSAMVKYCVDAGVSLDDIVRDDIGFSTYETMYNVVCAMGYKNIIVVTQEYHMYRAIYIAKCMGAEADGFSTDYRSYSGQIKRDIREYFARSKDFIKTELYYK